MADASPDSDSPDPESPDPFSSPVPEDTEAGFNKAEVPPWATDAPEFEDEGPEESFALDMARLWAKQHQKATMLGAFAAGVFVGALLRD